MSSAYRLDWRDDFGACSKQLTKADKADTETVHRMEYSRYIHKLDCACIY